MLGLYGLIVVIIARVSTKHKIVHFLFMVSPLLRRLCYETYCTTYIVPLQHEKKNKIQGQSETLWRPIVSSVSLFVLQYALGKDLQQDDQQVPG